MASRPALRKAIITNNLSMPHLVNVVANIVGVWPLIVSYLKETGHKDEGDSLVVRYFFVGFSPASWKCVNHRLLFLEEGEGRVPVPWPVRPDEIEAFSSRSRNL